MPALVATIGLDSKPFRNELMVVDKISQDSGKKIIDAFNIPNSGGKVPGGGFNPHGGFSYIIRETLVLFREIGRGNWNRVPGSLSILLTQLILKFPQLGQVMLRVLSIALGPLGLLVTGLAGAAFALRKLGNEADATNKFMFRATQEFERQAEAINKARQRADEYAEVLRRLHEPMDTTVSDIEDHIRNMREEFELNQKNAARAGQSPEEKRNAEIEQAKAEAKYLNNQANATAQKARDAEIALTKAHDEIEKRAAGPHGDKAEELEQRQLKHALETADEIQDKLRGMNISGGQDPLHGIFAHPLSDAEKSKLVPVETKSGERMTLDAAKANLDAIQKSVTVNKQLSENLKLNEESAKQLADKLKSDREHLVRQRDEAEHKVKRLEQEPLEQEKQSKRLLRGSVNSLQAVGAYAMPGQVELIDVAKKSEKHLAAIAKYIRGNQHHTVSMSHTRF